MLNEDDEINEDPTRTSERGVPAAGAVVRDRFSSDEIFQRIIAAADEEVTSSKSELFFSGIAAGLAIIITYLAYASLTAATGGHPILSVLLYPVGFMFIIIGGYQLYTENTLPPVALTLERFTSLPALFRHWIIVLAGNFTGGAFGALVLAYTGVLSPDAATAAAKIAKKGFLHGWWTLFFKGTFAGLIVAGVVWVEYASRDTISRLVIIYIAFLLIPLCNLFHVVVSFAEVTYMLLLGKVFLTEGLFGFVLPVLLGNTIGGVLLVTVINYYQTSEQRLGAVADDATVNRLTAREWLFGGFVGRSHVPFIEHHRGAGPDGSDYRITVPVSDPEECRELVELACVLAGEKDSATVQIIHIIQAVPKMNIKYRTRRRERLVSKSEEKLSELLKEMEGYEVSLETSTVVAQDSFREIFNRAREDNADLVLMEWDENRRWETVRTGRPLDELTSTLPCDFLILKDRGLDTSRILIPTAGGPDSQLSAEVAALLRSGVGSEVALLHVVDSPEESEKGQEFLKDWTVENGLEDAEIIVDDSGDIEGAIAREAEERTLVIVGATERGLLSRLYRGSLHLNVVNRIDASVLLAERPTRQSLWQLLFGS